MVNLPVVCVVLLSMGSAIICDLINLLLSGRDWGKMDGSMRLPKVGGAGDKPAWALFVGGGNPTEPKGEGSAYEPVMHG